MKRRRGPSELVALALTLVCGSAALWRARAEEPLIVLPGPGTSCGTRYILAPLPGCDLESLTPALGRGGERAVGERAFDVARPFTHRARSNDSWCAPSLNIWSPSEGWWSHVVVVPPDFRGTVACSGPGCDYTVAIGAPDQPPTVPVHISSTYDCDDGEPPITELHISRAWLRAETHSSTEGLAGTVALDEEESRALARCAATPAKRPARGPVATLQLMTEGSNRVLLGQLGRNDVLAVEGGRFDLAACAPMLDDLVRRSSERRLR